MANVKVYIADSSKPYLYEGEYDVALGPEGVLVVNEMIPDVIDGGPPKVRVKCLYNNNYWDKATLGD
jgi:hypothetical protein